MEKIKQYIHLHFYTLFPVLAITAVSLFTLMIRLKVTHSFFFLFLVWNLFLAFVPFMISFALLQHKGNSRILTGVLFIGWLLFLPNAPYIITDLIHLQHSESTIFILDATLLSMFALGGLLCYVQSMYQMEQVLARFLKKRIIKVLLMTIPFLTGFGIYLGRFLRFNSWDIIQDPMVLITDILQIITQPRSHIGAWIVTLGFGCFLLILYRLFKKKRFQSIEKS